MNFNKNDIVELTIENFGNEGEGIGHVDGYTLFVKGAVPGDRIKARILKVNKNYGFAKIEEILEASADREAPPCPVYDKCGGCSLMHVNYARELKYKEDKVRDCIERIGGFKEGSFEFLPVIGMGEKARPLHYRNKAQFPVGEDDKGQIITGFYASRSHRITPIEDCPIEASVTGDILKAVKNYMISENVPPYDEINHKGLIRHIMTRIGFATGEVGVCLVINGSKLPETDRLVSGLKEAVENKNDKYKLTSATVNVNKEKTNVIMGKKLSLIYGNSYITDKIGDIAFHISPMSFYQVNHEQTEKLYGKALEYAGLTGNEVVWDLYCGIGTISLFLAKKAAKVYGVEIVPEAIENAKENAELNNITNAEFSAGAAEDVAPHLPKPDVIVVDPPRKGCDARLIDTILKYKPKRVVYVSCDPATLARDLKLLAGDGAYKLRKVQPVDQFSGSFHVETVALAERVD